MALLKDTLITGNLRVTDTTLTDTLQADTIKVNQSSTSDTKTAGTSGQVLMTNGESAYWGTVASSDINVTQTATTTSANYEVLLSGTADNTTRTEGARKNSNLTFNPSTGNLQTTQINGVTVGSSPKFTDTNTTYSVGTGVTITGTNNAINVTYGTAANTACQGNDSRLSDSRTPTSHTHGNIQNGGTLQTTDITIASGDKLVVTDNSDSNKIARTSISFDGSTATKALTQKGTWETFGTSNLTLGTSSTTALKGDTKYAGSSSAGGAATSANKINTDGGSLLNPVYFSSGVPVVSEGNTIPFITGTGSTAGTWLGELTGLTEYYDGLLILYKPAIAGASTTTLNLNSIGAKTCYINNTSKLTTHFPANQPILLVYSTSQNSGCWMCIDDYWTNSDTYTSAYCGTKANVAAKVGSCTYYIATANSYIHITFRYANTSASALTLNINSQGDKPIYINGTASSSTNYTLPAGSYIAYYNGTNYYFRTDGKLTGSGLVDIGGNTTKFLRGDGTWQTPESAGASNKTGTKMFLVGATSQTDGITSYSNSNCYIGTDNCLYSGGTKVLTSHQSLSGYQTTANKVTSLSSSSTDTQYPSAKCVYDLIGNVETLLAAI